VDRNLDLYVGDHFHCHSYEKYNSPRTGKWHFKVHWSRNCHTYSQCIAAWQSKSEGQLLLYLRYKLEVEKNPVVVGKDVIVKTLYAHKYWPGEILTICYNEQDSIKIVMMGNCIN